MQRGPPKPPSLPAPPGPSELPDERLKRLEAALAEGRAREDAFIEAWVRRTGHMPSRKVRREWERKWRKEAKREARRAEREAHRAEQEARRARRYNPVQGGVYAAVASTCVLLALAQPRQLWWLVFVALGFFLSAAKHLERPRRDANGVPLSGADADARRLGDGGGRPSLPGEEHWPERLHGSADASVGGAESWRARGMDGSGSAESGAAVPPTESHGSAPSTGEVADPRVVRVDALCGKLLAELREGPAVLREVVHAPERTVEALRKGCHELARRERGLRALSTPEETRRLESEREALFTRVSTEQDAVVRERLTGALAALDEQRRQRAELATAANRLEAEHTRLYYTLESLYAQVLRVRSADAVGEDIAGAGLRHSVEQLGAEVEAVTQALEEAHRPPEGRSRTR